MTARVAVVGHVEWVDFLEVDTIPARGQITPARRLRRGAAGGAVVAAAVIAELGAAVELFGAVGDDELGARAETELRARGIVTHLARRPAPTREVITFLDAGHERSIVTIGERLAPAGADPLGWERLGEFDAVYVTAADAAALGLARAARRLVATPRIVENLAEAERSPLGFRLDALVLSGDDRIEVAWAALLAGQVDLEVVTEGAAGGHIAAAGAVERWTATPPPGPIHDAYGAGDSFAAGFTYGLATGLSPVAAAQVGARCGSRALTRAGGP